LGLEKHFASRILQPAVHTQTAGAEGAFQSRNHNEKNQKGKSEKGYV
jgi:hypothetical protein